MTVSRATYFFVGVAIGSISLIFLNPFVIYHHDLAIAVSGLIGTCWCLWEGIRLSQQHPVPVNRKVETDTQRSRPTLLIAFFTIIIVILWLSLHRDRISNPTLDADDFDYVRGSISWTTTWENLLVPYNEHLCPFARIMTFLILQITPEKHQAAGLTYGGMALFVMAMPLVYIFVRNELHSEQAGLVAVMVYTLTPVHREVIDWYSASLWIMSVHLLLASLILLQTWNQNGRLWRIVLVTAFSFIAPLTFALGWLVGPICTLYLLIHRTQQHNGDGSERRFSSRKHVLAPLIGTVIAAVIITPMLATYVVHESDYGGKPFFEAIHPIAASRYATQWIVDVMVLWNLDLRFQQRVNWQWTLAIYWSVVLVIQVLMRRQNITRPVFLGFLLIAIPYGFILPFRAWVPYEVIVTWTRYQLWPQLGWSILLCSILCDRQREVSVHLTKTQSVTCAIILLVLGILHAV